MRLYSLLVTAVTGAAFVTALPANPQAQALDCLRANGIPDSLPGSPDFAGLELPFNIRLNYTPSVIIVPKTEHEIALAVKCACNAGVKVQAPSGGHSYASFSTGGQDGSMIIDLENLNNVYPNYDRNHPTLASFGSGVRLGNLDTSLYNARRALSHGTCAGIGVGGHFLHGGYGHTSRNWGLALDAIVAMDMVLANGSIVHTSPDPKEQPDLFWAMRGAGDAFGIVTTFYVETQAASETVINFGYTISGMYEDKNLFVSFFEYLQQYVLNNPNVDRKLSFGIYMDGKVFNFVGQYFGNPGAQSVDWVTSMTLLNGGDIVTGLDRTDYTKHDNFFAKSLTIPEPAGFTERALQDYHDYIVAKGISPQNPWFSIINLYGGLDSQINVKDSDFAAYRDRDALWVIQHYGNNVAGENVDLDFINGLNDVIAKAMPDAGIGAYLNYIDPLAVEV